MPRIQRMKKITFLTLLSFLIFSSCSPEAEPATTPEKPEEPIEEEKPEEEEEEEASIDYDNIVSFRAQITSPVRSYSYNYQGIWGAIFHDPAVSYTYKGKADFNYKNSSNPVSASQVSVSWRSDLDGILYEGVLKDDFTSAFQKQLSKGYHTLTVKIQVGDNEEYIKKDSISFSNHISLSAQGGAFASELTWTKYEGDDFQSYLIVADGEPIAEIEDINTLQFLHKNVRLATQVNYQVLIKRTSEILEPLYGSSLVSAEAGNFLRVPHFITKVAKSPQDNLIYSLVGQTHGHMDYAEDYGVLILEDTEEGIVTKDHILKDKRFSDLVISRDGKYLFLVYGLSDYITRVDLTTQEITEFYVDTHEWGLQKIDVGLDYRLYVARKRPTSGDSPMYIIDGLTGARKGYYSSLIHGDIIYNNFNNKLYHNTSVREKSIYRFSVENDSPEKEISFSPDINYPSDFMLISDDGKHIFWDKFQLDPDLNLIREFEEGVIAVDKENQFISNGKELKDFQTLEILFEYPLFPHHDERNSNEIFNDRGDIIFFKPFQPWADSFETVIFKFNISEVITQ